VSGFLAKADENYECANEANKRRWTNAAASRYYYAAFVSTLAYHEKADEEVPFADEQRTTRRWTHSNIWKPLVRKGFKDLVGRLATLRDLRVTADYDPVPVNIVKLQTAQADAMDYIDMIKQRIDSL